MIIEENGDSVEERTNQQNAQINFGLINLLLFNHSNMFRSLSRSHHQAIIREFKILESYKPLW